MNKKQRQDFILNLLEKQAIVKVNDIVKVLKIDRTTIYRDFKELLESEKIVEI
jgi:DeoR/GlpR family transcriptional regulator of sugar metabolism